MSMYKLTNPMINSHWGCTVSMSELFGYENKDKKPMAELWMGAHPKSPSYVNVDGASSALNLLIEENPVMMLGAETAEKFSVRLPFLFKVLSAKTPLSIQSHPSKKQAEAGWAKENALKIALDASERNYKDDNHKPELVYALTPYHALNGFRSIDEIIFLWEGLNITDENISLALNQLVKDPTSKGLKAFYQQIMISTNVKSLVAEIVLSCTDLLLIPELNETKRTAYQAVLELNNFYENDIGVLSGILLNYIVLQPNEAMYLTAGTLHAYLKGTALELMANSDNVLRGGLTPKHVDIDELMNTIHFEPLSYEHLKFSAVQKNQYTQVYQPPIPDFKLSVINLTDSHTSIENFSNSADILFVISGEAEISCDNFKQTLKVGESIFIPASVSLFQIEGTGRFAIASDGL